MEDLKCRLQFNKETALVSLREISNRMVALLFIKTQAHSVPTLGFLTQEITERPNSKHEARDCGQVEI